MAVFIPRTIPGETVKTRIVKKKKNHAFGNPVKIIDAASSRIIPLCETFGKCGGCDYLMTNYKTELSMKMEILTDNLVRIGSISPTAIPKIETISSERHHYRSHAEIKYGHNGKYGFFMKNSHTLVPFPQKGCLLFSPEINNGISYLPHHQKSFRIALGSHRLLYTSFDRDSTIREEVKGIIYERDITSFFQANCLLREKMIDCVIECAQPDESDMILDLACGVGFFTLPLAKYVKNIIGVDINKKSIELATQNAELNGIRNAQFTTENFLNIITTHNYFQTIIVDPPRAGITKNAKWNISRINPEKIVYVSCDPSTFSRDTKEFIESGLILKRLILIDMFPTTMHIEVIALFMR